MHKHVFLFNICFLVFVSLVLFERNSSQQKDKINRASQEFEQPTLG